MTPIRRLLIVARRAVVGRLYLRGDAIWQIAYAAGVSPATVSRDIQAFALSWRRHPLRNWRGQHLPLDCELPVKLSLNQRLTNQGDQDNEERH